MSTIKFDDVSSLADVPRVIPGQFDELVVLQLGKPRKALAPEVSAAASALAGALNGVVAKAEADIAPAMGNVGYLPPVAFSAGIVANSSRLTVERAGQVYAPLLSALPFTTTAVFNPGQWRLVQGATIADVDTKIGLVNDEVSNRALLRPEVWDRTRDHPAGTPIGFSDGSSISRFGNAPLTVHPDGYYTHVPAASANSAGYIRRYTGPVSDVNGIRHIGCEVAWPTLDVAAVALVLSDAAEWTDTPTVVRSVAKVHGVFYGNGIWHISVFNAPGESKYMDSEAVANAPAKVARFRDVRNTAASRKLDIQFDPRTGVITAVLPDGSTASKTVPTLVGFFPNQAIWELYEPLANTAASARFQNPVATVGPRAAGDKGVTSGDVGRMINAAPVPSQLLPSRNSYKPGATENFLIPVGTSAEITSAGGSQVSRVSAVASSSGKMKVRIRAFVNVISARAIFFNVVNASDGSTITSTRVIDGSEQVGSRWIDEEIDLSGMAAGAVRNIAIHAIAGGGPPADATITMGSTPSRQFAVELVPVN